MSDVSAAIAAASAKAPTTRSTIGLKDFVICKLLSDDESGYTYDTDHLQRVAGAIEASVTPDSAEPSIQYADDVEWDVLYPDPDVTFRVKMVDFPLAIQQMIYGSAFDNAGVLVKSAEDEPPYFAVGFRSQKSNKKYRYVWLYKCRATPITENYATKQGATITRQEPEVEFTAIKRTYDGRWQAVADEGENNFTANAAKTFLTSVYEPNFTA